MTSIESIKNLREELRISYQNVTDARQFAFSAGQKAAEAKAREATYKAELQRATDSAISAGEVVGKNDTERKANAVSLFMRQHEELAELSRETGAADMAADSANHHLQQAQARLAEHRDELRLLEVIARLHEPR